MKHSRKRSRKSRSRSRSRSRSKNDTAYCVKCKKIIKIVNPKVVVLKNGRRALKGTCPYSDNKVFRFIR